MSRLTISLNDDLHQAVRETAARQGRSITAVIEESLRFRGIRPRSQARQLVASARARSGLPEQDALSIALEETQAQREE